ncbi:hypothetical protein VUR80DRAFT_301 [Thermomyces stellatus]
MVAMPGAWRYLTVSHHITWDVIWASGTIQYKRSSLITVLYQILFWSLKDRLGCSSPHFLIARAAMMWAMFTTVGSRSVRKYSGDQESRNSEAK